MLGKWRKLWTSTLVYVWPVWTVAKRNVIASWATQHGRLGKALLSSLPLLCCLSCLHWTAVGKPLVTVGQKLGFTYILTFRLHLTCKNMFPQILLKTPRVLYPDFSFPASFRKKMQLLLRFTNVQLNITVQQMRKSWKCPRPGKLRSKP